MTTTKTLLAGKEETVMAFEVAKSSIGTREDPLLPLLMPLVASGMYHYILLPILKLIGKLFCYGFTALFYMGVAMAVGLMLLGLCIRDFFFGKEVHIRH